MVIQEMNLSFSQKIISVIMVVLLVTSISMFPIAGATSHTGPPPSGEVFAGDTDTGGNVTEVWERAGLPLRIDNMNAAQWEVSNADWQVEDDTGDLKPDTAAGSLGVFVAGDTVSLNFDEARANKDIFTNEDVTLVAAHIAPGANLDGVFTVNGAIDLLTSGSNADFELVDQKQLSGGTADFTYQMNDPGHYVFYLARNETGEDGLVVSNGNIETHGDVTIIGVEYASVEQEQTDVSPSPSSIEPGDSISFTPSSSSITGTASHVAIVYKESTYGNAWFKVTLDQALGTDFDIHADTTLNHSIAEVNGVGNIDAGMSALGVTLDDGNISKSGRLASLVDFTAEMTSGSAPDSTADDTTVLDGSITATEGNPTDTVTVDTFSNWSEGTYRWIYIAGNDADTTELTTRTGTITIETSTSDGGSTGGDDDDEPTTTPVTTETPTEQTPTREVERTATKQITDADPDSPGTTVRFSEEESTVQEITFEGEDTGEGGEVTVTEYDGVPDDLQDADGNQVVHALDIDVPESRRGSPATITVTINADLLGGQDPANARVAHRRDDGTWEILETELVTSDSGQVTLRATVSSFSVFGIVVPQQATPTGTALPTESTPEPTEAPPEMTPTDEPGDGGIIPGQPGFGPVVVVLAILLTAGLLARRRDEYS